MGTLEKVMQLKQNGQTEFQIAESLKQQGISPREINEAISQSKIKDMLNNEPDTMLQQTPQSAYESSQSPQSNEEIFKDDRSIMQPSMMQPPEPPQESQLPLPKYALQQSFQEPPSPEMLQPNFSQYPEYQEYEPQETSIETINEIAEQIVDEKTSELNKQISSFTRFKEELAAEVLKLSERILKIENTLNELQTAIIRKIGDYGEDIKNIAKEMHSTQDSFSKILNPLTDNIRELQKITGSENPKSNKPKPKAKSKSGASFEDYLR